MYSGGHTANLCTLPYCSKLCLQRKTQLTNPTNSQCKIMKTQTNIMHTTHQPTIVQQTISISILDGSSTRVVKGGPNSGWTKRMNERCEIYIKPEITKFKILSLLPFLPWCHQSSWPTSILHLRIQSFPCDNKQELFAT